MFVRIRSTLKNLRRLMNIKGIPFFLEGRKAEIFKHCATSVDLDRLNTALEIESQDKPCYVIASNDVQLFCQSFLVQHTVVDSTFKNYEFRVTIHRMCDDMLSKTPAQTSPQRRLLEPFAVLHSVPHFQTAGAANTEYCASIAAQVSRMAPTVEEYFNKVIEMRDNGLEHFSRNDFEGAIKLFKTAFSQLITTCYRRKFVETGWKELDPELQDAMVDSYLALVANLAFLHYRTDDMGDTHFWACDATEVGKRRGTMQHENLYARLVYLKAIASARLGKHPQAVEELCHGLTFVTREAYRDKELVAMRRELRHQIKGLGGTRVLKAMGIGHL